MTADIAHQQQDIRVGQFDMAGDEGLEHRDLLRRRVPVLRRAPRQDIGDVDRARRVRGGTVHPDRVQHPVQQLPSPTDKGFALPVLIRAGRLAYDHHTRLRLTVGKDEVPRPSFERAMGIGVQRRVQSGQRGGPGGGGFCLLHRVGLCYGGRGGGRRGCWLRVALRRARRRIFADPFLQPGARVRQGGAIHRHLPDRVDRAKLRLPVQRRKKGGVVHGRLLIVLWHGASP